MVSIMVDDAILLHVHRTIASYFSSVWKRALSNPDCRVVTVTFPPDSPAASLAGQLPPKSGSAPVTSQSIPPPPPPLSYSILLKFLIQWMEQGGADPKGKNAVPYPAKYREGLERLLYLAKYLEVKELVPRVSRDLGEIPLPKPQQLNTRPKICLTCKKVA